MKKLISALAKEGAPTGMSVHKIDVSKSDDKEDGMEDGEALASDLISALQSEDAEGVLEALTALISHIK